MSNFFDRIESCSSPFLHKFINKTFGNPRSANVEEALIALMQIQQSPERGTLDALHRGGEPSVLARQEMWSYCERRLRHSGMDPMHWAYRMMLAVDKNTAVITTNYDTCADTVLESRMDITHGVGTPHSDCHLCRAHRLAVSVCTGDAGLARLQEQASSGCLLRLHGSIEWRVCVEPGCASKGCVVPKGQLRQCKRCRKDMEPLLILPSVAKSYEVAKVLDIMWHGAKQSIQRARRMIVFGFSFPHTDTALNIAVRDAAIASSTLHEVIVVDVNPAAVADRIRKLLRDKRELRILEMPVPTDGSEPAWWHQGPGCLEIEEMNAQFKMRVRGTPISVGEQVLSGVKRRVRWCVNGPRQERDAEDKAVKHRDNQ